MLLENANNTPESNAALLVSTIQPLGCWLGQKLSFSTHPLLKNLFICASTIKREPSSLAAEVVHLHTLLPLFSPSQKEDELSFVGCLQCSLANSILEICWDTRTSLFSSHMPRHLCKIACVSLNLVLACFRRKLFQP